MEGELIVVATGQVLARSTANLMTVGPESFGE
jgi:hypothetical protein